ncbi:protein jag [Peptococcaceae bacterium]|nr:protein jag [Peptococcaceae bacterium]
MKELEVSGRTVEDALRSALLRLGVSREEVDYEVIDEGSKGLFGIFGARTAKIRVVVKQNPVDKLVKFLKEVTIAMGLLIDVEVSVKEQTISANIKGENLGVLIGRRGETLDDLQYLSNLVVNKNSEAKQKIILDIEGYRNRRKNTLQKLALRLADKVRKQGKSIVLEPMNAQERRVIHTTLQSRDDIYTFSEGEEPYRKIVIAPKK